TSHRIDVMRPDESRPNNSHANALLHRTSTFRYPDTVTIHHSVKPSTRFRICYVWKREDGIDAVFLMVGVLDDLTEVETLEQQKTGVHGNVDLDRQPDLFIELPSFCKD